MKAEFEALVRCLDGLDCDYDLVAFEIAAHEMASLAYYVRRLREADHCASAVRVFQDAATSIRKRMGELP